MINQAVPHHPNTRSGNIFVFAFIAITFFTISATAGTRLSNYHILPADTDKIYAGVEHAPQPKGGTDAFEKFFLDNMRYAFSGNTSQLQGRIYLRFVVEKDGSLSSINILTSTSKKITDAAISILKICPNWLPGTQDGKSVRVQHIVPISFDTNINNRADQPVLTRMAPANYSPDAEGVYSSVETSPVPPGGAEGMANFLKRNVHYPAIDKENNVQGRVIVQFIIEKDGSLSNLKAVRTPSATLGEEAIRALRLSPNWEPGKMHGEPVRVRAAVPVNFTLGPVKVNPGEFYESTLSKFIFSNIKYPKKLQDQNVSGMVIVNFIIDLNHNLNGVNILKSAGTELDNEVTTLVQNYQPPPNGPAGTYILVVRFYTNEKPPYEIIPKEILNTGHFVTDMLIMGSRYY